VTALDIAGDHLVVTGTGHVIARTCDSTPFLKSRKSRKFMGRQDELAVVAASRAIAAAGQRLPAALGERCGLYLAVGFIPFEEDDLDLLVGSSILNGAFSMTRFSTDAFRALNPLLTFRCLPNMPAFHVSLNLDVQGPYWVGYPGIGQFYLALEEAGAALAAGTIDLALVGGVADQENLLVRHHFSRVNPPVPPEALRSAAAFVVLERRVDADRRGAAARARLLRCRLAYEPADPFERPAPGAERFLFNGASSDGGELGPASLGVALSMARAGSLTHDARSRDGFSVASDWDVA
jgi:hypothetical protein